MAPLRARTTRPSVPGVPVSASRTLQIGPSRDSDRGVIVARSPGATGRRFQSVFPALVRISPATACVCPVGLAIRTAGATFAGALKLCETLPSGSTVLAMLPDTGERYLSTPLFEDIAAEMSDEEKAISNSTPLARFDN